jgi:hypothetical protein
MSKEISKVLKLADKFKKNSEKEMERIRAIQEKNAKLTPLADSMPALVQFFDRVKQKELQASGDLIWIDQFLAQLRAEKDAKAAASHEAFGKDGEKKKKSKSK